MRVWDQMHPKDLCRQHLLAQWMEGRGLWNILTQGKKGYANHPETKRWRGYEAALMRTLARTRIAMEARGWNPKPLPDSTLTLEQTQTCPLPPPWDDQLATLRSKNCPCEVPT